MTDFGRRRGPAFFIALAMCTIATSAASSAGRTNPWTTPHVLTISDAGDVNTLNPHFGQLNDVGVLSSLTMAYLVKWDEHNQPYPELATRVPTQSNGDVSEDGLTITYHLRRGVKWSDGTVFDADDLVFTSNVVRDPKTNEISRGGLDNVARIDEPDKYTVVYHMKKPESSFIVSFFSSAGGLCILPKHLLASYTSVNDTPYNALPIGIGPFKYERWDRGDKVVMVADPLYFRGRPKLDKIVFKIIPDRNTLLTLVQAHAVDLWYLAPGNYYPRLQAVPGFAVYHHPGYGYSHLDFNVTHPALADSSVRRALRLGLNREDLKNKLGQGLGVVQDVTTPQTAPYYVAIPVTPFDMATANRLLEQAGWRRGTDGIRVKNGVRLSLLFAATAGMQDVDNQIELIRSWWTQLGVELDVQHFAVDLMFAEPDQGGIVYGNKWDVVAFTWQNGPMGNYAGRYGCDAFPPNGQNVLRWCSKRAQAAMDGFAGHFEQSQRDADIRVVQEEFVKDVPSIVTLGKEDVFAYNKDLTGFHPNNVAPFDNMLNVDI
jgi:peptide/nickel transport system substrate-binding protein